VAPIERGSNRASRPQPLTVAARRKTDYDAAMRMSDSALVSFFLLASALSGCGDAGETIAEDPDAAVDASSDSDAALESAITHVINGWTIRLDMSTGAWSVTPPHGGEPVLEGPPTSTIRVGLGEPWSLNEFGAFQIELESDRSDIVWESVGPPVGSHADTGFLRVDYPLVDLRFSAAEAGNLRIALEDDGGLYTAGELAFAISRDDAFFGLGTQAVSMDLRGRTYPLWTQEQGIGKPEGGGIFPLNNIPEAAYAPMGIWHSSAGYSAILGHDAYSEIDLGDEDPDRGALRSYPELPSLVLVAGETPRDRMAELSLYTGRLTQPPPWLFAPWNDAVGGPERLWEVATSLRENDIPSSAIWSEDWIGGTEAAAGFRLSYAWAWDPELYPDLAEDIAALHDAGFAFLGYFNPFVPGNVAMWDEGIEGDFLVKDADGEIIGITAPAFRPAGLVDLYNPDAEEWLRGYLTTAADDLGIDGWMADFAEWLPVEANVAGDVSGWLRHNDYPLRWQQINREVMAGVHASEEAENNWVFFVRSGWASVNGGTGGIVPALWGGDQNTNWEYDDGFPTVLPIGTHVGLSGVPIFGSDIAGYTSVGVPHTTKELFYRWSALGAFHPLMRTHHGSSECGNWSFDRDAETLQHYRRYTLIHSMLYPLFDNLTTEAIQQGLPLTRHPYLVEPDRPGLWSGDQYEQFLGDDLLIAPVLSRGGDSRDVTLPSAGWWPLFGDGPETSTTQGEGGVWSATFEAAVTEMLVFVRPGTIVPLLWEPVDSFYGSNVDGVRDLEDVAGRFRLALYPDADGGLAETTVGEATVSGAGWNVLPADWSGAMLNGDPIAECGEGEPESPCVDGDTAVVRGREMTLSLDDATLTFRSAERQTYRIGRPTAVWGELARPTAMADINPDVTPPCEE
jgi:alpha-glucosidase (family GH31 glycosyl hydrolase)